MPERRHATRDELIELLAEKAHNGWMAGNRAAGVTSRRAEWGEEFMVPYADLSERAKNIDRNAVGFVFDGLAELGAPVDTMVELTVEDTD